MRPAVALDRGARERASHAHAFASTVALTLANPSTILSFAAAAAALFGFAVMALRGR
jgi:hypothetical protein